MTKYLIGTGTKMEIAMPPLVDLSGKKFGRLSVIGRFDVRHKVIRWKCLCECGNVRIIGGYAITSGHSKSCGCLNREISQKAMLKHGHSKSNHTEQSPEYGVWQAMIQRCENINNKHYSRYGGRGISVCERWRSNYNNFYADMGERPHGTTIDRIDNDKGYEPGNCRWATRKEQQNNLSSNHRIVFDGETRNLGEWADHLGIDKNCLAARINRGWDVRRAFTQPSQNKTKVTTGSKSMEGRGD